MALPCAEKPLQIHTLTVLLLQDCLKEFSSLLFCFHWTSSEGFFSFMHFVLHNNKKGCYLGSNLYQVSTSVDFTIFCSVVGQVALSLTDPWHIFRAIFLQQAQKTQSWLDIPILFQRIEWHCWPEHSESFVMDLQVSVCALKLEQSGSSSRKVVLVCWGFFNRSIEDGWCRILFIYYSLCCIFDVFLFCASTICCLRLVAP